MIDLSKFNIEAENTGKAFGRIKVGNYSGVCSHVIDMGTQLIEGKDKKTEKEYSYEARKVFINFAFQAERVTDTGEILPREEVFIGRSYTVSFGPNSLLFKHVQSWLGTIPEEEKKKFNVYSLVGKPASIGVGEHVSKKEGEDGEIVTKKYDKFLSVSQLMDGVSPYVPTVELGASMLTQDLYNEDFTSYLSVFDRKDLENSQEFAELFGVEKLEDQESNMKKEAEARKEKQKEDNAVETVSAEKAGEVFE